MRYKPILFILLFLPILYACGDGPGLFGCGGRGNGAIDDYIDFKLKDKSNQKDLLGLYGIFDEDTVKIYDKNKKLVFKGPVEINGKIVFYYVDSSTDLVANQEISKNFYLYLNQYDTDTIKADFQLEIDKCNKYQVKTLKVYYNNVLYYSGQGSATVDFFKII